MELIGFGSTGSLKPNESEEVTIEFSLEDLASYDYRSARAWVLDAGSYGIALQIRRPHRDRYSLAGDPVHMGFPGRDRHEFC